jgi:hypothetical protein
VGPALVADTVARTLGVVPRPGWSLQDVLRDVATDMRCLLLVDNCEHVVAEAAGIVAHLLAAGPHVRVLATSREPLGVPGEVTYPVPTMPVPAPDASVHADTAGTFDAIRLFVARAVTAAPGFTLTDEMAPAVRTQRQRAETAMTGRGEAIRHGYRNELEASIIVDLVTTLSGRYRDWAVIVPFNAQKELVIERLAAVLGSSSRLADNVGSVDSFQGGERDLIVFGFTRSNPRGDIGFLRELRRFNVAITRAKRQLVLVGDLSTLRIAKDDDFRNLMIAMDDHLTTVGDRRRSLDVATALRSMRDES